MKIKLKPEFAETEISFNNSGKPLGQRSDLNHLLILAHRAGRQDYLDMFETPPSLAELLEEVADKTIGELPEITPALNGLQPTVGDNVPPVAEVTTDTNTDTKDGSKQQKTDPKK